MPRTPKTHAQRIGAAKAAAAYAVIAQMLDAYLEDDELVVACVRRLIDREKEKESEHLSLRILLGPYRKHGESHAPIETFPQALARLLEGAAPILPPRKCADGSWWMKGGMVVRITGGTHHGPETGATLGGWRYSIWYAQNSSNGGEQTTQAFVSGGQSSSYPEATFEPITDAITILRCRLTTLTEEHKTTLAGDALVMKEVQAIERVLGFLAVELSK